MTTTSAPTQLEITAELAAEFVRNGVVFRTTIHDGQTYLVVCEPFRTSGTVGAICTRMAARGFKMTQLILGDWDNPADEA